MTPEQAHAAAQSTIACWEMLTISSARKAQKGLMNVNPALKSMAEEENTFQQAVPMIFGKEYAKKAMDRVEAIRLSR